LKGRRHDSELNFTQIIPTDETNDPGSSRAAVILVPGTRISSGTHIFEIEALSGHLLIRHEHRKSTIYPRQLIAGPGPTMTTECNDR
jgi:hypothetical protein